MKLLRVLPFAVLALSSQARAEGGCGRFAWPIEADAALLSQAERVDSGATVDVAAPKAVRVLLVDSAKVGYELPPEKPAAPAAPGGTLRFEAKAGLYQLTMTDRVWLDVVQAGRKLDERAFSGAPDCDGARKSVRFELGDGPTLIQFSGSPSRTVAISVTRAPKDRAQ